MAAPFSHTLRVRFRKCDPQGIVFNGNYVGYFDDAFTELWRSARFDELVGTTSWSKTEIPDWVRAGLEPYLGPGD